MGVFGDFMTTILNLNYFGFQSSGALNEKIEKIANEKHFTRNSQLRPFLLKTIKVSKLLLLITIWGSSTCTAILNICAHL